MNIEVITRSDFQLLKDELIAELKALFSPSDQGQKAWLKSNEVRKLLSCSHGTLQNLRIKGILTPNKIGGVWYYQTEQISNLLQNANTNI